MGTSTSPALSVVHQTFRNPGILPHPRVTMQGNSGPLNCKLSSQHQVVWDGAGIRLHKWRNLVCVGRIALLPESLMADDSAAILLSNGAVLLNGTSPLPRRHFSPTIWCRPRHVLKLRSSPLGPRSP